MAEKKRSLGQKFLTGFIGATAPQVLKERQNRVREMEEAEAVRSLGQRRLKLVEKATGGKFNEIFGEDVDRTTVESAFGGLSDQAFLEQIDPTEIASKKSIIERRKQTIERDKRRTELGKALSPTQRSNIRAKAIGIAARDVPFYKHLPPDQQREAVSEIEFGLLEAAGGKKPKPKTTLAKPEGLGIKTKEDLLKAFKDKKITREQFKQEAINLGFTE